MSHPGPDFSRRLAFAASCLGMLVFGIVMTTLGSVLPSIIDRFGLDRTAAGSLFTLMSLGILLGSLVFGPVVDRRGYKGLLVVCAVLVLLGLQGIALAPTFAILGLASFVTGVGGGGINGGTNALVADISEGGRSAGLSLLGVFFGIGAFGMPFALGFLLASFSYSTLVAGIGALVLVPLVFFVAIRFPAPKQPQGFPLRHATRLFGDRVLLLMGFILFIQSGMEITVGGWTTTYFNEQIGLAPGDAVFFLSLFWVGMVVARLILGWLLKRADPGRVLMGSMGLAFAGSCMLLIADGLLLAAPGILLVGAGLAATFPVILGYVADRYAGLSGTAFSVVFVMALVGGSTFPLVAGALGEVATMRASFGIVPLSLLFAFALLVATLRRLSAPPRVPT
jgi:MFS transporter, FHS family, glucose/mannose:H+ symporter